MSETIHEAAKESNNLREDAITGPVSGLEECQLEPEHFVFLQDAVQLLHVVADTHKMLTKLRDCLSVQFADVWHMGSETWTGSSHKPSGI